jgi:hypothetical protein
MAQYMRLNEQCRGGSGDNPATHRACDRREAVYDSIEKKGWCWGPNEVSNADKNWIQCGDMGGQKSKTARMPSKLEAPPETSIAKSKTAPPSGDTFSSLPYCSVKSAAYKAAAQYRDQAVSPQDAWAKDMSIDDQWHYVGAEERKAIINKVYFDPSLSSAHGEMLSQVVYSECMNQHRSAFKPLE